jgi:hypothetical protein
MNKRLPLFFVMALGLLGTHAASAKTAVDPFAEFKGTFTGSASFVVSSGSPPLTGTGTLKVTGPKNGKSVVFDFSGVTSGGAYSNTITVSKKGAYTVSAGVFNLIGAMASAVSGRATIKKKVISGNGSFILAGSPATAIFSIQSKTSGKKRTLTVNYTVTNSGGIFPFQFIVTGKVKK